MTDHDHPLRLGRPLNIWRGRRHIWCWLDWPRHHGQSRPL